MEPEIWKFQASQKGPKMDIPKGRMDNCLSIQALGQFPFGQLKLEL